MKQSLELFSGTAIVSKVLVLNGFDSITVDYNPFFQPDICCDILSLSRSMLPNQIDFIWASPDCRCWSRTGNPNHWRKIINSYRNYTHIPLTPEAEKAVYLLQKLIYIISWFPKAKFVIENPIGKIHHRPEMKILPHYRYAVNYADFGFDYSKETYLFTNFLLPFSAKKVSSFKPSVYTINNRIQRSAVPVKLIEKIVKYI